MKVVTVTPAGAQRVAEAREVIEQVQADVLARLPAGQRDALMKGLARLVSEPFSCAPPG